MELYSVGTELSKPFRGEGRWSSPKQTSSVIYQSFLNPTRGDITQSMSQSKSQYILIIQITPLRCTSCWSKVNTCDLGWSLSTPKARVYTADPGQVSGSGQSNRIQGLALTHSLSPYCVAAVSELCVFVLFLLLAFHEKAFGGPQLSDVTLWRCTLQPAPATKLVMDRLADLLFLFSSVIGGLKMTRLYGRNETVVGKWGCMFLFLVWAKLYKHKHCYNLMAAKWLGPWVMCDCSTIQLPV